MNQEQLMTRRNDIKRLLNFQDRGKVNDIRLNPHNTEAHEMAKVKLAWQLLKEGKQFVTEARWINGAGRADLVCLDDGIAYEIIATEEEASIASKRLKYPLPIELIRL